MKRRNFITASSAFALGALASCQKKADPNVVRFGHFPNVTHVQGLVAHALSRQGKGWFEEKIPGVDYPNLEDQRYRQMFESKIDPWKGPHRV